MTETTIARCLERWTATLGALARPFVLYAAASSSAAATVSVVWMRLDLFAGAAFVTASWGGVALLYGAKALEERGRTKSEAAVAIAQTNAGAAPVLPEAPPPSPTEDITPA